MRRKHVCKHVDFNKNIFLTIILANLGKVLQQPYYFELYDMNGSTTWKHYKESSSLEFPSLDSWKYTCMISISLCEVNIRKQTFVSGQ